MQRWLLFFLLAYSNGAQGLQLEWMGGLGSHAGDQQPRPHFGIAIDEWEWETGYPLRLGIDDWGIESILKRSFDLSPVGAAQTSLGAWINWRGRGKLEARAEGTLAQVALKGKISVWNAARDTSPDPFSLSRSELKGIPEGWQTALSGRYRLERNLILDAAASLGEDTYLETSLTWASKKRDFSLGLINLEARLTGLTLGWIERPNEDISLGSQASIGWRAGDITYGIRSSVDLYGLLPLESDARFYLAYEPWDKGVEPLKYGLETQTPFDLGTLKLKLGVTSSHTHIQVKWVEQL